MRALFVQYIAVLCEIRHKNLLALDNILQQEAHRPHCSPEQ